MEKGIIGQALILYLNGDPIACSTEPTFTENDYLDSVTKPPVTGDQEWTVQFAGFTEPKVHKLTIRPNDFPRKVKKRLKAFFHCKTNYFHYNGLTLKG